MCLFAPVSLIRIITDRISTFTEHNGRRPIISSDEILSLNLLLFYFQLPKKILTFVI
nr:hypothetical protein [uncultured bacterium]